MAEIPRGRDDRELARRLAEHERRLEALERAARLPHSSIGSGGLVVRDGGGVTVEDGGEVELVGGGSLRVQGGGGISVEDGGDLVLTSGGTISLDGVPLTETVKTTARAAQDNQAGITPTDPFGSLEFTVAQVIVSVPSWADEVAVMAVGFAEIRRTSGSGGFGLRVQIDGVAGLLIERSTVEVTTGEWVALSPNHGRVVAGPGSTVTAMVQLIRPTTSAEYEFRGSISVLAVVLG